jgi:hypothetical protein
MAMYALAAPMAPITALMALVALGLAGPPFHEPFHARGLLRPAILLLRNVTSVLYPGCERARPS